MIIGSSLSPNHLNNGLQYDCTKSWSEYGKVYCLQSHDEVVDMKDKYPHIHFVPTHRIMEKLINKKLISINAIIDLAKEKKQDLFIVNSDILLNGMPLMSKDAISVFQRQDYHVTPGDGTIFNDGFDCFYIPYKFLNIYPPAIYAMGACWWDYWIPYRAIREQILLKLYQGYAHHKKHNLQWNQREWLFYAQFFKLENAIPISDPGMLGKHVLQTIKNHL